MGHKMPLEHLELLPVLKTDDVVGFDRRADRNLGFRFRLNRRCLSRDAGQSRMHVLDKVRQVVDGDAVVADVRGDDVCRERKQRLFSVFKFGHSMSSTSSRGHAVESCTST